MKYLPIVTALDNYVSAYRRPEEPSFWDAYFWPFLLTMFISLIVYCVPVLIYRSLVRDGQPLESKWKATWVGWIFWICSFTAICLYYLAAGYYEEEGFSVRAGLPDFICMALNWFLLYHRFGSDPPAEKEAEIVLRNVNNTPPQEPAPEDTHIPRCSACGSSLSPNAKFCPECGEKVLPPGMTICQECGKLVEQGKFCTECGCRSTTDILPNAEAKNPPTPDSDLSGARVDALGNIVSDSSKEQDPPHTVKIIKSQYQPDPDLDDGSDKLIKIGFIVFGVIAIVFAIWYAIFSS